MGIFVEIKKAFGGRECRESITKMLYVFIFSMLLFYYFDINKILYINISFGIWLILLINYKKKENVIFYFKVTLLCFCNLITFVLVKYLKGHQMKIDVINIIYCIYAISLLIFFIYCCMVKKNTNKELLKENKLFLQRKHDLERIIGYLNHVDIIGLNGSWGSGKTFLIDALKVYDDIQKKYIFIKIDLLSCNLDDIQTILLNEMEKVLFAHRIFSRYFKKLKKILGQHELLQSIGELLVIDDLSFSEVLSGFRQEIESLDRTILVVYEDIDRINDSEIIRKIFSISENLSSNKIKVIYQYDEENLKKIDDRLDRSYIEKYIPYTVNLTEINFFDIIDKLFVELDINKDMLTREDFSYLKYPIYVDHYASKILQVDYTMNLVIRGITIRKVKLFLNELITSLKQKEMYRMKETKQDVITFYFIKHFWYSIYEQFNLEDGLLETLCFEYHEQRYTILQLIRLYKHEDNEEKEEKEQVLTIQDIKNIFKKPKNREILTLLSLFGYQCDIYESKHNVEEVLNESVLNITHKNINEKKDRLIWNLLCNGKSEYTDQEFAVNKLNEMVLSKPKEKQGKAFRQFLDAFFTGNFENKDNTTIFRMGISEWHSLFQALCVANVSQDQWLAFLKAYFNSKEVKNIDVKLIENLKYCNLRLREVYLDILKRFNELQIIGNMNGQRCYKRFLKNYLEALSLLQYISTEEVWGLENEEESISNVEFVQNYVLKPIKEKMEKQREAIQISSIRRDIDIIIAFIQKNYDIIGKSNSLQYPTPHVNTSMHSEYVYEKEFNRLSSLELSKEEYLKEVEESYRKGEIGAYEIMHLPNFNKEN